MDIPINLENIPGCSTDFIETTIERHNCLQSVYTGKDFENVPGCSSDSPDVLISLFLNSEITVHPAGDDVIINIAIPQRSSLIARVNHNTPCIPILKLKRVGKTRTSTRWKIITDCVRCSLPITKHTKTKYIAAMCNHETFNANITQLHYIGQMNKKCVKCAALKFIGESVNFCCVNGAVHLPHFETPVPEIVSLYDNKNFLKNIRAYNSVFGFTSVGATTTTNLKLDKNLANAKSGVYTFKIQGTILSHIVLFARIDHIVHRYIFVNIK